MRAPAARSTGSPARPGTPTFPNDDRSLDDLARLCAPGANAHARRAGAAAGACVRTNGTSPPTGPTAQSALDEGHRRAHRAQLARRHRPRPRRRRPRTEPGRGDRVADRRAARGRRWQGARDEARARSRSDARASATRRDLRPDLDVRRRASRTASPTSRTRCVARSCSWATFARAGRPRPFAARAARARRRRRRAAARVGSIPAPRLAALRVAFAAARPPREGRRPARRRW